MLVSEIAAIVGAENVCDADFGLPVGWAPPLGVATPADVAQVAAIVKTVENAGAALTVIGGGTQLQTGYPPRADRPYLLLSTARFDRITDFQPEDLTVTCEPGVTLATLQARLSERRLRVALEAPLPERSTLGGIVSAARTGFNRVAYGAPRDLVIGLRAVMNGGVEVKGGGKVVKNVAGYDVCKLFTGAWGTLGVVTELTFKLSTLPETQCVLAWNASSLPAAARVALKLHHARLTAVSFLVTNEPEGRPCLIVGLEGVESRVEWQTAEYARLAALEGLTAAPVVLAPEQVADWRDGQAHLAPETSWAAQVSCLPAQVAGLLDRLNALPDLAVTADCATGIVSLAARAPSAAPIAALTEMLPAESNLVWTRLDGSDATLQSVDRWGKPRAEFALHRALKQAIDPKNTFSPGRFYGRL